MFRRVVIAATALSLLTGACSKTAPPGASPGTNAATDSPSPTPGSTPDVPGTPRARPADRRPAGQLAPAPAPPGRAPQHTPPAPGRYAYTQTGSFELGAIKSEPDPVGTLTIEPARVQDGGQAQRHIRTVSERNETTSVYLFTTTAVLLTYISQQGVECAPEPALTAITLPLKVGGEWESHGVCGDVRIDLVGKVAAAETLTIAGDRVETFRIRVATEIRAPSLTQSTGISAWVSPAHRLIVRSEEVSRGTYAGAPYTSTLKAAIRSVTPS